MLSSSPRTTTPERIAPQRDALADFLGWEGGGSAVTVEALQSCSAALLLEAQIQLNLRGTLVVDGEGANSTQPFYVRSSIEFEPVAT